MPNNFLSHKEIDEILTRMNSVENNDNDSLPDSYTIDNFSSSCRFPKFINYYLKRLYAKFHCTIIDSLKDFLGPFNSNKNKSDEVLFSDKNLLKTKVLPFKNLLEELIDPPYKLNIPFCSYTPITRETFLSENEKVFLTTSLECINDCLNNYLDEEFEGIHDFTLDTLFLRPLIRVIRKRRDNQAIYKENTYFDQTTLSDDQDPYDEWVKIEIPIMFNKYQYFLCLSMKITTILSLIPIHYPKNLFHTPSFYEGKNFVIKMGKKNLTDEYISNLKEHDIIDLDCPLNEPLTFCINNKKRGEGNVVINKYIDNDNYNFYITKRCEDEIDNITTYVALNYDNEENYNCEKNRLLNLSTEKGELLPLVHNNNIVAMVRIVIYNDKILFKVIKKAE